MVAKLDFSLEICKKLITIVRNEETFCEWCDTYFAVRVHKGIHFYELSHNLESLDKRLDCLEGFIANPTTSPSTDIFECKFVRTGLKNRDMSEMILDTAMWGHSEHLINEMSCVIQFEFSPPGLIRQTTSALAILNNLGNVELYRIGRNEWVNILNVSACVKNQFEECLKQDATNFHDLKTTAYNLATSSICWSPNIKDNYCYLVTCQKGGVLLFWSIQSDGEGVAARYCGKIDMVFDEVIHMKWIPKSENKFILLCSSVSGQVIALECQKNKKHVIMLKAHKLWDHKDKMITKYSMYIIYGEKILLFYNKHRHLIAQLIDENCRIISQSIDNINDYRITSLAQLDKQHYVTTVNFKIYQINYSIESNILNVKYDPIDVKEISPTMELYSLRFSNNGVMCALSALDRRVMHKKTPLQMEIIFLQIVPDSTVLDILFNNPTKKLTNYWDCIELLRYRIVKLKTLFSIDFKTLLTEGETDVYKLKLYLIFLRIYKSLLSNIKMPDGFLPENSIELIKDKILMAQARANIKNLYNKSVTGKELIDFEKECFVGSKKFLQLYSKKYKVKISKLTPPDMFNLVENELKYACQCCDETIDSLACPNGHLNMFCSLTFTPIDSLEYIACKYCNTIARLEIYSEKPTCIFCDSYLEMYLFSV